MRMVRRAAIVECAALGNFSRLKAGRRSVLVLSARREPVGVRTGCAPLDSTLGQLSRTCLPGDASIRL